MSCRTVSSTDAECCSSPCIARLLFGNAVVLSGEAGRSSDATTAPGAAAPALSHDACCRESSASWRL